MNQGKMVIVTGAGGGIWREIALAYARSGAKVVVNDIGVSLQSEGGSEDPGAGTVRLIREAGREAVHDANGFLSGCTLQLRRPMGIWIRQGIFLRPSVSSRLQLRL